MREILFRGKRKRDQEWVYGFHLHLNMGHDYICDGTVWIGTMTPCKEEVIAESVGQYTGLADKNGKKIFEGDVVRQTFEKTVATIEANWGGDGYEDLSGEDVGAVVIIPSKGACVKNPIIYREVDGEITHQRERVRMYKNVCSGRCEVIGNIHDNPELLEG